jgi:hypothetical protein
VYRSSDGGCALSCFDGESALLNAYVTYQEAYINYQRATWSLLDGLGIIAVMWTLGMAKRMDLIHDTRIINLQNQVATTKRPSGKYA